MDKSELQNLISAKSGRVTFENIKGESQVWQYFVSVKLDDKLVEFVKCVTCLKVLKWKSRDGTSGLRSHMKSCSTPSTANVRRLTDLAGFHSISKPTVPAAVKSDLADVMISMCATDIRLV